MIVVYLLTKFLCRSHDHDLIFLVLIISFSTVNYFKIMNNHESLIDAIDSCLPQTQCGLCEYAGCRPYASALVNQNERIDRCLPGGIPVLIEIAALLEKNPDTYMKEMQQKAKLPSAVSIREEICIGCTKCLAVCPVDAIIGTAKMMHTVIQAVCTGCDLCIPACPVDCIDVIELAERNSLERKEWAEQSKQRYHQRLERKAQEKQRSEQQHQAAKLVKQHAQQTMSARQKMILAATARVHAKKQAIQSSTMIWKKKSNDT